MPTIYRHDQRLPRMTAPHVRNAAITLAVFLTMLAGLSVAIFGFRSPREVQAQSKPSAAAAEPAAADKSEKFTPEIPIPVVFTGEQNADDTLLTRYIRAIYIYFVWVVGIVAVVMVMYGGIRWVSAAGNPGQIKEARDIIDNAVIGVLIALVSVVLLNIINPKLTQLAIPGLTSISVKYFEGVRALVICPSEPRITCGEVKKIGTVKVKVDGKDKEVDDYCMGTTCSRGGAAGFAEHTNICSLKMDSKNNYKPHQGCTDVLAKEEGGTWEVSQATNFWFVAQLRGYCGVIAPARDGVWPWCAGSYISAGENVDPQCYLVGPKTKPEKSQTGIDFIPNICCPGKTCPHEKIY
ncbi:MAG: hypothetical protein AAB402_01675 [Patescibacteria group bacterium]